MEKRKSIQKVFDLHHLLNSSQTVKVTCVRHGEYEAHIVQTPDGKEVMSMCPRCLLEMKLPREQPRQISQREEAEALERMCGVPMRYAEASFDNYYVQPDNYEQQRCLEEVINYAADFNKSEYRNMILMGSYGTGKTHLVCAITRMLHLQGYRTFYITAQQFFRKCRDAEVSGGDVDNIVRRYASYDLFVVDEIGVQSGSQYELRIFFDLVNRRYNALKPTIISTNMALPDLTRTVGDNVMDRLMENALVLPMAWPSYRTGE